MAVTRRFDALVPRGLQGVLSILCLQVLVVVGQECSLPPLSELRDRKLQYGEKLTRDNNNAASVQVYYEMNGTTFVAVGVEFTKQYVLNLDSLPTCAMQFGASHPAVYIECPQDTPDYIFFMNLPTLPNQTFQMVRLDWLAKGHYPKGIYDKGHFDIQFMFDNLGTLLTTQSANGNCRGFDRDTYYYAMSPTPAQCYPGDDFQNVGFASPLGGMWVGSSKAPEQNGQQFTDTFFWGLYGGAINFFDVALDANFMKGLVTSTQFTPVCKPIPGMPKEFAVGGGKPQCYCIFGLADKLYVELRQFKQFPAACTNTSKGFKGYLDPDWIDDLPSGCVVPGPNGDIVSPNPFPPPPPVSPPPPAPASRTQPPPVIPKAPAPDPHPLPPLTEPATMESKESAQDSDGPLTCDVLKQRTFKILYDIKWPNSARLVLDGHLPDFEKKVKGRVVPVGRFEDVEGALEYFYVLAGPATTSESEAMGQIRVAKVYVPYMNCDPTNMKTDYGVEFLFSNGTHDQFRLQVHGFYIFNAAGRVCSYDWTIRRLGLVMDKYYIDTFGSQDNAIYFTCMQIQSHCSGEHGQYASVTDCVRFMKSIPFGSWDTGDQNNFMCRSLHVKLTQVRPAAHCPHTGPAGGNDFAGYKCLDHPYEDLYLSRLLTCDVDTIAREDESSKKKDGLSPGLLAAVIVLSVLFGLLFIGIGALGVMFLNAKRKYDKLQLQNNNNPKTPLSEGHES